MKNIFFGIAVLSIMCSVNTWSAVVNLGPVGDVTDTSYRWMDIADNLYRVSYRDPESTTYFNYSQPTVTLTYNDTSNTFSGTLTATGLKPNFAYQMKLQGQPVLDDWANEQIGYAGRWWYTQYDSEGNIIAQGNAYDDFYILHNNDPNYKFDGYLLFDFFVTDDQGNATVDFTADSSYHVLWATHNSTSDGTGHRDRETNDSAVRYYDFTASDTVNSLAYDIKHGDAHVGIYGEWEFGRALPGDLVLALGEYNCEFILTEESFHQSGLGGYWAGAMGGDVTFTVVPIPASIFLLGSGLIGIVGIRRKIKK